MSQCSSLVAIIVSSSHRPAHNEAIVSTQRNVYQRSRQVASLRSCVLLRPRWWWQIASVRCKERKNVNDQLAPEMQSVMSRLIIIQHTYYNGIIIILCTIGDEVCFKKLSQETRQTCMQLLPKWQLDRYTEFQLNLCQTLQLMIVVKLRMSETVHT